MSTTSKEKKNKYEYKTEYEIWRNIIPKNNNLKETYALKINEIEDVIQINQYVQTKNDLIGRGFYGEVFKVQNQEKDTHQACKIFKRSTLDNTVCLNNEQIKIEEFVLKELVAARLLKNVNLTIAHELIDDLNSEYIYLIMELCDGEFSKFDEHKLKFDNQQFLNDWRNNFFFNRKQIDEVKLKKIFNQLANGVMQLHNLNLTHCDIKPQNIMIKDGNAKIADFGSLAWTDPTNHLKSTIDNGFGTPQFQAPESVFLKDKSNLDKFKLDIWALGVTYFIFAFGFLPYEIHKINGSILPNNFKVQWDKIYDNQHLSNELKAFIEYILNSDPIKRPTIFELIDNDQLSDDHETNGLLCNFFCKYSHSYSSRESIKPVFFNIQGLNSENMVNDSSSERKISEFSYIRQKSFDERVNDQYKKKATEKKTNDQKRSIHLLKSKTVESAILLDPVSIIFTQSLKSNFSSKNSINSSTIIKDISKTSIKEENEVIFNNLKPVQNNLKTELKTKSKLYFKKISHNDSQIIESKNSSINQYNYDVSSKKNTNHRHSVNESIEHSNSNISQRINKESMNESFSIRSSINCDESNPNQITKTTQQCIFNIEISEMKNLDNDKILSKINRSSISVDETCSNRNSFIRQFSNHFELFDQIYESIMHKQRKNLPCIKYISKLRRKSDSNQFDVLELKNDFNNKDHIIQECLKNVDILEKSVQ